LNQPDDLEKEIFAILADGIVIGRLVEEFIYSSTGINPDPVFFEEAISSESSELEAAMDLIFFPDDSARSRVEKFIVQPFKETDENLLIDKIIESKPVCSLRFEESGSSLAVPVPGRFIARFVKRFNLCFTIPEHLRELIGKHYSGREYSVFKDIRARAREKNAINLIISFLENVSGIFQPEIEDLNIVMTVSGMFPEETGIISAINRAYIKWESTLKKHEDLETALASGCMEELMAKGMRIQAINRDDIEIKMAAVSRVMNLLSF